MTQVTEYQIMWNQHYFEEMNKGDKHKISHIVAESETALAIGSGGLPVYATPSMICLMEQVSYELAAMNGLATVGTSVDIRHTRACRPGTEITAEAEVVQHEARRIVYKVKACDAEGMIGEGLHERYVIDEDRFMAKLG